MAGCGWVFFFKQKTAYEMRISDWSSDVCSSDLQLITSWASVWMGKKDRRCGRPNRNHLRPGALDASPFRRRATPGGQKRVRRTMSKITNTKPAAAVPSRASKVSRKALAKSDEAQVVQRPDMDTLVKTDTVAEAVDVMSFQGRAESVPSSVLERFEQDAKPARAAMNDAIRQEGKSRSAHARSIGLAHAVVCSLCEQPEVMWAMLALKGTKVTERTAKSPCLPAIKALYPDLDRREQSSLAQVHNHGMACGWSGDELSREVDSVGSVAIIKRERQRQRLRAGNSEIPDAEATLDRYRSEQRGIPLTQVSTPEVIPEGGFGLLVAGVINGELRIFDVDDSEKRVIAAIKHCVKRGCALKTRAVSSKKPKVAWEEDGDE